MINTSKLYFRYGEEEDSQWALKDVDLQLTKGKYIVILGENGSGKSTLAKQFNVLLLPTKGKVTVDDLPTSERENLWEIRDKVSMVFQNPNNQIVGSTVEEDLAFGMENREFPVAEMRQRLTRCLAMIGMTDKKKRNPIFLSGGQKQKLAIAGALATDAEYLILDESTAMLDTAARDEVMEVVHQVCATGTTTVINITHFVEEALHADEIFVMSKGQLIMHGSPREVFAKATELESYHIKVPTVTRIGEDLRRRGYPVETPILSTAELVKQLNKLRSNNE